MEKQGEPPSYNYEGSGLCAPQAPPNYSQAQADPQYPAQQQYSGGAPPPQYTNTNVIVQQPIAVLVGVSGAPPPDHMGSAIFVTLCCFWPTGIVAIMRANEAKNAWMRGDTAGAHSLAQSAKSMVNVSIIAGICSLIFLAIFIGVYVGVILKNINDRY